MNKAIKKCTPKQRLRLYSILATMREDTTAQHIIKLEIMITAKTV